MLSNLRQISALGQSIWLDFIDRELLTGGKLERLIADGLTGMTSNPTIFQKAIAAGHDYDADLRRLAATTKTDQEVYEALALADIRAAADHLRPVYNETHGRDGFVSLEVNPTLAHDTAGTIEEGQRLFHAADRPNLMIKVPATEAGIPAIAALIGQGINVNVTLIFAVEMYEAVISAYLDGLQTLQKAGKPLGLVSSVASFFVSRVDTLVDDMLQRRIDAGEEDLRALLGKAAIANARLAYAKFRDVFESSRFATLRAAGARVQRPLWASTSTKNPDYPPTKYVDALIGPYTVNTVPPATLELIQEGALPAQALLQDVSGAKQSIRGLEAAGIDMRAVTAQLLEEGLASFAKSFRELLADVHQKRTALAAVA
ncbi:MAG: transaldolase [Phycisphaerae bacterium]